jgi:hypothetical protein
MLAFRALSPADVRPGRRDGYPWKVVGDLSGSGRAAPDEIPAAPNFNTEESHLNN